MHTHISLQYMNTYAYYYNAYPQSYHYNAHPHTYQHNVHTQKSLYCANTLITTMYTHTSLKCTNTNTNTHNCSHESSLSSLKVYIT